MERSNNGAYSRTQNIPSGRALEGRASVDSQGPRLQKKRSNAGVRNASQPLPAVRNYGQPGGGMGEGGQARKGSLRNVVRRIFGRRSKELEPQIPQRSPPRHGHHVSEPPALAPQVEEPEMSPRGEEIALRTLSAPLNQIPSPTLGRTRSPYAVEFPQSARLRPIQLPNPFYAPGSQLRRRKTLPSILLAGDDAKAVASSIESSEAQHMPSIEIIRETPTPDFGATAREIKQAKRRSRSANDLKGAAIESSPPRKRSDEIKYWRDSFQGTSSVLRASGFVSRIPRDTGNEDSVENRTPQLRLADPFDTRQSHSATLRSSPPVHHGPSLSETDIRSTSGYGTELSRDLEDRVAKLEAGLQTFQRSLSRLTADRNRSTVLVGNVPQRRSSIDARTPSMLADTLADPLALAIARYGSNETERPSTSPQPPRTPARSPSSRDRPPVPPLPVQRGADPFTTSSPQVQPAALAASLSSGSGSGQPQSYTFRSLYEMLTDERSARRRLEMQMRGLQREISDLQYQVSVGSHVQSQRSSFAPMADPMVGSSRLRDLLRETELSPPGTADSQQQRPQRESGMTIQTDLSSSATHPNVMSRFSNSESEAGATIESTEDLQTPYEAYQTPREEHARFPFGGNGHRVSNTISEGEMF